jgi:hypothetical protein
MQTRGGAVAVPGRIPGGAPRRVAVAVAAALAVLAALLPWVSAPLGYEQLQQRGLDSGCGVAALLIGIALVLDLAVSGVRGRALLNGWFLAVAAVALAVIAALGGLDVRAVLDREVSGIGVHPGRRGPGLVVLWFAVVAAAAAAGLALRDRRSATRPGPAESDRADEE